MDPEAPIIDSRGDPTLYAEAYPRLRRYIGSLVHDPSEAEDLTQEAFLRAFRGQDALRDPQAQMTWLYRIATNVSVDRMRRRARQPVVANDELEEHDAPDAGPALQQVIEQDEMSACVQDYIVSLPDNYRAVLMMADLQEMSGPEIAELLGISLATVKIRLHRARQKLRAALAAGCAFEHDERNVLTCEPQAPKATIREGGRQGSS
jgi:RNA polymerase sigma-70 factor (ECF subfamily)